MSAAIKDAVGPYDDTFVRELYRMFLDRGPDPAGLKTHLGALRGGTPPHELVEAFLRCEEFSRRTLRPTVDLPNLRKMHPDRYLGDAYLALDDARINAMENLIINYGYYDNFGVWSSAIDSDKRNIATLVEATGAKSCLEVGCFNGPVLSVLKDKGLDVAGIELSHLAFVMAFPNIRSCLIYGDLLSAPVHQKYDCILLMDVLEHMNPLRLHSSIARLRELLQPDGVIFLNSPMFGPDPSFGTVFKQFLPQWKNTGHETFFREWPCDDKGWPMHGHMVWASPAWWERQFAEYDLTRVVDIESELQSALAAYFSWAPARKSMFCLAARGARVDTARIASAIRTSVWR